IYANRLYRLVMGGLLFVFFVPGRNIPANVTQRFVRADGSWMISREIQQPGLSSPSATSPRSPVQGATLVSDITTNNITATTTVTFTDNGTLVKVSSVETMHFTDTGDTLMHRGGSDRSPGGERDPIDI